MMKFFLLFAFFSCSLAGKLPEILRNRDLRIVGGSPAEITDAPYQVALLYDSINGGSYSIKCGGIIYNEHAVITSAQCVKGTEMSKWRVRAGTKEWNGGGQVVGVMMAMIHSNFSETTLDYDVAVLHLAKMLTLDSNTKSVATAEQDEKIADNTMAVATGWGPDTSSASSVLLLRKVSLPIVNQEECKKAYEKENPITDRMLCAGSITQTGLYACQGDIGGPLVANNKLVGITSWGKGCGQQGYPGVWTRVAAVSKWIDDNGHHHPGRMH